MLIKTNILLTFLILGFAGCAQAPKQKEVNGSDPPRQVLQKATTGEVRINPNGKTIVDRISPPGGFQRKALPEGSFGYFLRHLPLKPHNAEVLYYDGTAKENRRVYVAVADLEIGNKNLHQCADAIIRLRAEYLWKQKEYDQIHFNFTNGFRVDYREWMKGKRIVVEGNDSYWTQAKEPSNSYDDLWDYLETVFTYAGTLSLSRELNPVSIDDLKIGDVFIQGGSPGHAVMLVDMAEDPATGEKLFLLAQSFMPAQEIQILENPNNRQISPWYSQAFGTELVTPEWTFNKTDLKRFGYPE